MESTAKWSFKRKAGIAAFAVILLAGMLYKTGSLENLQGRFGGNTLNKAQVIKMIVADTGVPLVTSTAKCTFTDIVGTEWYANYFYTACENGWLSYPSAVAIEPNVPYNKAEISKIAYVAYAVPSSIPGVPSFSDVTTNDWFYSHVESLNAVGAYAATSGVFGPDKAPKMAFMKYLIDHL